MADMKALFTIENFNIDLKYYELLNNSEIIKDITSHQKSIVDIVNALESVLIHNDKNIRKRGMEFVSWLLSQLPRDFLSSLEIKFFTEFFCSRLGDHHSFIPESVNSLLTLVNMKNITYESCSDVIQKIFGLVTCQAQAAKDRYVIYQILRDVLTLHQACIEKFDADIICNIISSIEGETDPLNLLLLFGFLPQLFCLVQEDTAIVDIFEVCSTYFPVDFTTAKKGEVVITREDLAEGLQRCLTASSKLAEKCLPMILDKLASTFKAAKIDSYKLLQSCCDRLNVSQLESSLNPLWRMMQRDLLPALDPAIQQEALTALSALTATLNNNEKVLENFLDDVIIAIHSLVSKPKDSLFSPAIKILEALCQGSKIAARRSFLEIEALCRPNVHSKEDLEILLPATIPFISPMIQTEPALRAISVIVIKTVVELAELRTICLQVLQQLVTKLSQEEAWRKEVFAAVVLVFRTSSCTNTVLECSKLVRLLTQFYPEDTIHSVYSELERLQASGDVTLDTFFEVAIAIVDIPDVTQGVLQKYIIYARTSEYSEKALESLLKATRETNCNSFRLMLFETLLDLVLFWNASGTIGTFRLLSHLLKEVMALRELSEQINVLVSPKCQKVLTDICDSQLDSSAQSIIVLEGILGALWPQVKLPYTGRLVQRLHWFALNSVHEEIRRSSARLLASFVNKNPNEIELDKILPSVEDLRTIPGTTDLFCWTLKGALLSGYPKIEQYISLWFSLLHAPSTSDQVALNTRCLLQAEPIFLNESCHCTIRYLYTQRLFTYLPQLARTLLTIEDVRIRNNYLMAAVTLCSYVPQEVIIYEINVVALVVSQAMQATDTQVIEPALSLLLTLLREKSSLFLDHSNSLLKTLLNLSKPPACLPVRQTALKCIFYAGFYPTTFILPYRNQIVKGLIPSLDDHKRLVRNEAARARQKWCLVGAAGEDE